MQAGRELDVLVAEKVMGLRVVALDYPCGWSYREKYEAARWPELATRQASKYESADYDERGPVYVPDDDGRWPPSPIDPGEDDDEEERKFLAKFNKEMGPAATVRPVPFYSTDLQAAWEVWEKLPAPKEIRCDKPDAYYCQTKLPFQEHAAYWLGGYGTTVEVAICMTAIAWVDTARMHEQTLSDSQ